MIEVLNKEVEGQTFYRQKCEECGAELRFAFDDTYEGVYGLRFLKCPACNQETATTLESKELTFENIEFPKHFYKFGNNSVDIEDKEIQTWIRRGIQKLETGEASDTYFCGTGNACVIILAMEDEYCIYVMKNHWECEIPKNNIKK